MDTKFFSDAMGAVGLPVTVIDENTDFSKLGNPFVTIPEFTKDNPNCHAQCAAEWDATREGRPFEIVPRGFEPLAPRPNGAVPGSEQDSW